MRDAGAAAQEAFDRKTKPRGSLGALEAVAVRVAALQGVAVPPRPECAIVVAAADHGVAAEGVSAYPQVVTAQMVANIARGGAAVSVLAREAGARLVVVDAGVARPCREPGVRALRFGAGTASIAEGPAMPRPVAEAALEAGRGLARELAADGIGLVAAGEMGIANTTAASALCARLLPAPPAAVCGRGTGLDDEGLARKVAVIERALAANPAGDAVGALAALGGFELALLAGLVLGCHDERVPVLLDGFVTGAAALAAARIEPAAVAAMLASHRSPEPGHALVLGALGLEPLLDLGLRLGEGSGAALALPLVRSALALLNEMASFGEAGVTDAGR
ncbi:MAG TPA: nicotinate-nucleotide--dimethylbenzimidazole phosphoribosyltransferase [Gaiellaceae bacterium]|nr:nicotinate-nucleotide--dimethylbenzimidazole phosphoribosyltransferase [Gaiellaceae bacterium]